MQGREFTDVTSIIDLGEIICCVYIYTPYEVTKAIQYLKWKGFRVDLLYRMNQCLIFYQNEKYVPDLDAVDQFYREVHEKDVWSKFEGARYDYKYRVISKGIVCISYINDITNEVDQKTGKFKTE